jgi:hypothetical protein
VAPPPLGAARKGTDVTDDMLNNEEMLAWFLREITEGRIVLASWTTDRQGLTWMTGLKPPDGVDPSFLGILSFRFWTVPQLPAEGEERA